MDKHTQFHFLAILSVVVMTSFQGCHPGYKVSSQEKTHQTR